MKVIISNLNSSFEKLYSTQYVHTSHYVHNCDFLKEYTESIFPLTYV